MVGLPRIIESGTVTADVADDGCISDYLGSLAIVGVVVGFFVFCPANVAQLLHTASVYLTAGLVTKLPAV